MAYSCDLWYNLQKHETSFQDFSQNQILPSSLPSSPLLIPLSWESDFFLMPSIAMLLFFHKLGLSLVQLWAACSRGVISGMLRLLPFLVRMTVTTCSAASSSSDHVFSSCRLLREPPKPPFPRPRVRNLDRNVTKERLLLRCFSQRLTRSSSSASPWSSSRQFRRTLLNSFGTSGTSGSNSDTSFRNLCKIVVDILDLNNWKNILLYTSLVNSHTSRWPDHTVGVVSEHTGLAGPERLLEWARRGREAEVRPASCSLQRKSCAVSGSVPPSLVWFVRSVSPWHQAPASRCWSPAPLGCAGLEPLAPGKTLQTRETSVKAKRKLKKCKTNQNLKNFGKVHLEINLLSQCIHPSFSMILCL